MTVIPFPLSPDMGLQLARDILRAEPGLFTDDEVRNAARFLMEFSPDWKDVQTANMVLHALGKKRDAARRDTPDDILLRSPWAPEAAQASRSMRVLNRVCAAACIAIVAVYGWTITTKAFAIHAADVARAQEMREAK